MDIRASFGYAMRMKRLFLACLLLTACAHERPVLYPNEHLDAVGEPAAKADVTQCMQAAKIYLKANPAKRAARRIGWGAAFGAVMGTVFGAFTGNYSRAIGEGAAVGAASGGLQAAWESGSPDEIQRAYTHRCLSDKGYSVIGWK
jgi:outer membrane lipoprotein SlyB